MFVGDELQLGVGFDAARGGLASLARRGLLTSASAEAYGEGLTAVVRVGPRGSAPGASKVVKVHFRDLVMRDDSAVLMLRWEATGPGGRLFPALDADITLTPAGEHATLLGLTGCCRPPLGSLGTGPDRAILHRAAAATIRAFLSRVADSIGPGPSRAGRQQAMRPGHEGRGQAAHGTPPAVSWSEAASPGGSDRRTLKTALLRSLMTWSSSSMLSWMRSAARCPSISCSAAWSISPAEYRRHTTTSATSVMFRAIRS
jgi:hypothetical protein